MNTKTREDWLAERRQGIGGSDAAAVLGLSPWATPVTVWLEKTGRSGPKPETPQMKYGNYFEDYVAKLYEEETGRKVTRYNHMVHDGCLLGNFDRLVVPEGKKIASHQLEIRTDTLLECKTSSREWDGDVPIQYMCQVMHYMGLVPALQHADVAVLFRTSLKFEIFRIERDNEAIAEMQTRLREWWHRHVELGEVPKPTCEADCKALWARSCPGKSVEATASIRQKLFEYNAAKRAADEAAAAADALKDALLADMGDAEVLTDAATGKPLATWKSSKDSVKTDWEGVARSLNATEEQIAAFTSTRPGSRRFLVMAKDIEPVTPFLPSGGVA